jgi:hypothetical protein
MCIIDARILWIHLSIQILRIDSEDAPVGIGLARSLTCEVQGNGGVSRPIQQSGRQTVVTSKLDPLKLFVWSGRIRQFRLPISLEGTQEAQGSIPLIHCAISQCRRRECPVQVSVSSKPILRIILQYAAAHTEELAQSGYWPRMHPTEKAGPGSPCLRPPRHLCFQLRHAFPLDTGASTSACQTL